MRGRGNEKCKEVMLKNFILHFQNDFLFSSAKDDLRKDYAT